MIQFPKSLKTIGDEAFAGCAALEGDLEINHDNLESVGKMAFAGCTGLNAEYLSNYEVAEINGGYDGE